MAGCLPGQGCVDPKVLNHTGSWSEEDHHNHHLHHQGTRASASDTDRKGASDGREAQSSAYPWAPLLPGGSAPHSNPYFGDPDDIYDLNEVARQAYQGRRTSTPNASTAPEPYNPILGRSPALSFNNRDGDTIFEALIDPVLSAGLPDPFINSPQSENLSQAQVDEFVRKSFEAQAPVVSEHAAYNHQLGADSTSDGGFGRGVTMPMPSRQHASTITNSRASAELDGPTVLQLNLFHRYLGVGQSEVPQLSREAATRHYQPQAVATAARPPLQRSPPLQPAFIYNSDHRVRPRSEHGQPSAKIEGYAFRDDSAGAGRGSRATSQHLGAPNYSEKFKTLQVPSATPSPHYRQNRPGSQASYGTPQSTPDHYFRHRQGQHVLGFTSAGANLATPADSITYSHDGSSERLPPPARPVFGTKRSSDFSFTQQSAQWSYGSNEMDLSSPLATTPSQANPTKKRCPSATSRSEAANTRFLEDLVGFAGAELVPPTTHSAGVSRQSSSAASARPFACEEPGCTKRFNNPAGLRHHADTHDLEKKTAHKCDVCGRGFRYPKDVERHKLKRHALEDSSVQCMACGNRYSRQDNLTRHLPVCPGPTASFAAGTH